MIKKLWNQVANATIHRNHVRPEVVQRLTVGGESVIPAWKALPLRERLLRVIRQDVRDLALALTIRDRVVAASPTVFGGG